MLRGNNSQRQQRYQNKPYSSGKTLQKRNTYLLKIGDQVYFHFALKDKGSLECKGYILRQPGPKTEGEVYKVIIAAVTTTSIESAKLIPNCIIGSKVTRRIDQLSTQAPAWWNNEWVTLKPQCIQEAINRARNATTKQTKY